MFGSDELLVQLNLSALPVLPGVQESIEQGIKSTMTSANAVNQSLLNWTTPDDSRANLLLDPQTSGGLLAAVPPDSAGEILDELIQAGYRYASIIGSVVDGSSPRPIVIS